MGKDLKFRKNVIKLICITFLLALVFCVSCCLGNYKIPATDFLSTLFGGGDRYTKLVIFEIRLPRLILSILVGLGMGMAGVVMQDLFHNELASPGTLGVSSGSGLFVTLYIAFFASSLTKAIMLPLLALLGGIVSAGLIFAITVNKKRRLNTNKIIMTGVALSSGYGAVISFVMILLDQSKLEFIQRWNSGELWGTEWHYIAVFASWLSIFIFIVFYKAKTLNAINLGYDIAKGLGVNVKKEFLFLSFSAIALSSSSVAFGGNFFFLGLIGPHIARKIIGCDSRFLLIASGMISAVIVLVADTLVRSTKAFANIPTGIIISILSVPYFLYLLVRKVR